MTVVCHCGRQLGNRYGSKQRISEPSLFEEPASREQGAREEPLEPGRHACHRLWPCWEVEARGLLTLHVHTCLRNFQSAAFLEHL